MTQKTLQIALLQLDLVWENPQVNREKIDQFLSQIPKETDIVFLPEMFTTGFSMNVEELAETMEGETIQWMRARCKNFQLALCGSLIIVEDGQYFNRLVFVDPSGEIYYYNKRHLFTMSGEENKFVPGTKRLVVNYKGWRICPLICYDLRFPIWSRNRNEYDLLVYLANWPKARNELWNTLLKARAIENQAYVAGANRIGVDGNSISYSGNSQLINPKGNVVASTIENTENIVSAEFYYSELLKFRSDFPVLDDADQYNINI
jgi:omega-amidase